MEERIVEFLKEQTNLTLATSVNNIPHCSNCFYSFIEEHFALVFKSSADTRHIKEAQLNSNVAGTILPDISKTGKIKGIQFTGSFTLPDNNFIKAAKTSYYKKYPFALAMSGDLWLILLENVKMVDNTLGFGKKLFWDRKDIISCK